MGGTSPCWKDGKDCPRRALHCHSFCQDYIEFDLERKRVREEMLRRVRENDTLTSLELKRNRNLMTRGTALRHGKSLGGQNIKDENKTR